MNHVSYWAGFFAGILWTGYVVGIVSPVPWWALVIVGASGLALVIFGRWCYHFGKKAGGKKP